MSRHRSIIIARLSSGLDLIGDKNMLDDSSTEIDMYPSFIRSFVSDYEFK